MEMLEALAYVLGFFALWGIVVGLTWSIDNWIVAPLRGKPFINEDFWK